MMNNLKLSRNLWIVAGSCFLLTFILDSANGGLSTLIRLDLIVCIVSFLSAFIMHKKIIDENKS